MHTTLMILSLDQGRRGVRVRRAPVDELGAGWPRENGGDQRRRWAGPRFLRRAGHSNP